MASENTIYFYPGRGGHSHDGENSSFIDTSKYSLFDFSWGIFGDPSRIADQTRNYVSFENFIIETVNNAVLKPANIILQPGTVNGTSHIISRSIDTGLITANAITANEILAGTITADELAANIVLVNNIISSSNYSPGVSGWAINGNGNAEFANTSIRGTIQADSLTTPGIDISSAGDLTAANFALYANGKIENGNFSVSSAGVLSATGANISGTIEASSLVTPGLTIEANGDLTSGGGATVLYADGSIVTSSGNFGVDTGGNLYAENATIYGEIHATSGSIDGDLLVGTINAANISGVNISGVNIDGSNITVGGRISLPSDGGQILLGTAAEGLATQVTIFATGSQGMYIDTSGLGSSWFAGATWYINLQEFISQRYITGLNTFTGTGTTMVVNSGGEVLRSSSKRELKDNIQDFNNISLIDNLRPVTFIWKKDTRPNKVETEDERIRRESSVNIGFIAEEVEEASDGLLSIYNHNEGGEGEVEMYKHLDITALSVANIKDLRARMSSLEARIAELEG